MVEMLDKYRSRKLKKETAKSLLRNRYYEGAKLSEYQFRLILQGFCDNIPAPILATKMRTSAKSIRMLYTKFRMALAPAIFTQPQKFGCAGEFLFRGNRLTGRGKIVLKIIGKNRSFKRHLQTHAPRLKNLYDGKEFLLEHTVRLFCHIEAPKGPENYPQAKHASDILPFHHKLTMLGHMKSLEQIIPELLKAEKERAPDIKPRIHHYPGHVLFEDLRQYLLKNPLNSASNQNIFLMRKNA